MQSSESPRCPRNSVSVFMVYFHGINPKYVLEIQQNTQQATNGLTLRKVNTKFCRLFANANIELENVTNITHLKHKHAQIQLN